MPECLGDEEKKSTATTDVHNFLGRQTLKIQVLSASDIDRKTCLKVQIFGIMSP